MFCINNKLSILICVALLSGCKDKKQNESVYFQSNYSSGCIKQEIGFKKINNILQNQISEKTLQKFKILQQNLLEKISIKDLMQKKLKNEHFSRENFQIISEFLSVIMNINDEIRNSSNVSLETKRALNYLLNFSRIISKHHIMMLGYLKNLEEKNNIFQDYLDKKKFSNKEAIHEVENYMDLIDKIKNKYNLNNKIYPVLFLNNSENNKVTFLSGPNGNFKEVELVLDDNEYKSFIRFKEYFNSNLNFKEFQDGYDTSLSKAFAIQALFQYLSYPKNNVDKRNLGQILKAHAYINMMQIGHDLISESSKISSIIKVLKNQDFQVSNTLESFGIHEMFSGASNAIASLFGFINIGFDIAEIANAQNQVETSTFSSQLFFDSLGVSIGLSGLLGGASISSFVTPLSIPLAGIGIGVTAIVQQSSLDNMQALEVAKVFNIYEDSHNINYFEKIKNKENTYLSFASLNSEFNSKTELNTAIIKEIDLTDLNKINIKFGSSYIAKTHYAELAEGKYNTWFPAFHPNPYAEGLETFMNSRTLNKNNYINAREELDIPEDKKIEYLSNINTFYLPITPETYYSYSYDVAPMFSEYYMETNDTRAITKLQKKQRFLFNYQYDHILREFAIRNLRRRYENTEVKLKLGNKTTFLITPEVPDIWKNKITYNIEGKKGGKHILFPRLGANYNVRSSGNEIFIFDITQISNAEFNKIKINNYSIFLNDLNINFSENEKPPLVLLKNKDNSLVEVDFETNLMKYVYFESKIKNNNEDLESYLDKLKVNLQELNSYKNVKQDGFIEILNEKNQYNSKILFKTWYDIKNKYFVRPIFDNDLCIAQNNCDSYDDTNNSSSLLGKINNKIYFYNSDSSKICFVVKNGECKTLVNNVKNAVINKNIMVYDTNIGLSCLLDLLKHRIIGCKKDVNTSFQLIIDYLNDAAVFANQREGFIEILNNKTNSSGVLKSWFDIEKKVYISSNCANAENMIGRIKNKYYFTGSNNELLSDDKNSCKVLAENIKNSLIFMEQLFIDDKNGFMISFDGNNEATLVDFSDLYLDINNVDLNIENALKSYKKLKINDKFLNRVSVLKSIKKSNKLKVGRI